MKPRILAGVARIAAVCAIGAAALGSASSQSQNPPPASGPNGPNGPYGAYGQAAGQPPPPPQPQEMEPSRALGLWKSTWGAVKIEPDASAGAGAMQGVFVYDQQGREVVGYFAGSLQGNVLQFTWQEPATPQPLEGAGYIVFDAGGQSFAGRWWTSNRDRSGEWNGWRLPGVAAPPVAAGPDTAAPPPPQQN